MAECLTDPVNCLPECSQPQQPQTPAGLEETGDMERDWDARAQENAWFYIDSGHWQSEAEFAASGEAMLQSLILRGLELSPQSTVLEIGCGIGRLLKPLARRIREAHGVDVSSEMIQRARAYLKGLNNVYLHKTSGADLEGLSDAQFDFCFSFVVFQHIPHKQTVFSYFEEVKRVLKAGGIFRFQVDGRAWDSARQDSAGTWAGVVFSEEEIVAALHGRELEILEIFGQDTQYLWVTARRLPLPSFPPPRPYDPPAVHAFFRRLSAQAEDWPQRFMQGSLSLGDIARFLVEQHPELEPQDYVHQVYSILLDRRPCPEERDFYTNLLVEETTDRLGIVDAILGSAEFSDLLRVPSISQQHT
jgi:SAM-dependent methyltransferase